jgi:ribulose 1,5-bisphosphate synthetase/thiazole synthase
VNYNKCNRNKRIDIISTNYANGGTGFMLLTTTSNKDAMKEILSNLDIKKTQKNEYIVSANKILDLSTSNSSNLSHVFLA